MFVLAIVLLMGAFAPGPLPALRMERLKPTGRFASFRLRPTHRRWMCCWTVHRSLRGSRSAMSPSLRRLHPAIIRFRFVPAGEDADTALVDESLEVGSDEAYTVAIANLLTDIEVQTFQSNIDDLPEGQSRVRAVSLSPDAGELDIFQVGGDQWFDNVNFGEETDHRDVDAGTYDLDIRPNDSDQTLLSVPGLAIDSGSEYSLYVLGRQSDQSLSVVPLVVSVQTACALSLGIGDSADNACLRVVHASLDGQAVDIYLEDALVAENLEPGSATDFVAVPSGDGRNVKLVPTGGTVDDFIVESEVDLHGGEAREVVIAGSLDDLKVLNDDLDLSPISADQARMRLVHASADAGDIDLAVTDGDDLFTGVEFESMTDPIILDAGDYDLQVRAAGEDEVLFRSESVVLDAGLVYSAVVAGSAENGTLALLLFEAPADVRAGAAGEMMGSATPGVGTEEGETVTETSPTSVSEAETPEEEGTPTS